MIGLHCETCDLPLVLMARVQDGQVVVETHPHSACTCPHSPEELVSILDDAYQDEM